MFIGYQNNIARYIKNTREDLYRIPCVVFDKVEEVSFAEFFNSVVYTSKEELLQAKIKTTEEMRASVYTIEVDPITSQINRLRDEEQTDEVISEIANLIEKRKLMVEDIKARYPYPTE